MRSLSPKRISSSAMASFSLTIGQHAEVEQPAEGGPGVEVLLAHAEVERGQQDLAADQPVAGEVAVPDAHQPALAHGRHGLEGDRVAGPVVDQAQHRQAGGDGARRHGDDLEAGVAGGGQLGAHLGDGRLVDAAPRRR